MNTQVPVLTAKIGQTRQARGYLGVAERLLPAIDVLAQSPEKATSGLAMLAAHSLECALKAYLAHSGMLQKDLKDDNRRHNLEQLWDTAVNKGLGIENPPPKWCTTLNRLHDKPYHLRYQTGVAALVISNAGSMIAGLKSVIDAAKDAVEADIP